MTNEAYTTPCLIGCPEQLTHEPLFSDGCDGDGRPGRFWYGYRTQHGANPEHSREFSQPRMEANGGPRFVNVWLSNWKDARWLEEVVDWLQSIHERRQ